MLDKNILNPTDSVTCPHCDKQFAVKDGLSHQLIEQYENEYESMLLKERRELEKTLEKELERKATKKFQSKVDEMQLELQESREEARKQKELVIATRQKAAEQAREEAAAEAQLLKEEIEDNKKKIKAFRDNEIELRRQKKLIEAEKEDLALEVERRLAAERGTIEKKVSDAFTLKEAEYKKKIADAQKANDELTRKLEQGSQQLQGEVLEMEIEAELKRAFPLDHVEEVKKGARGADIVQTVVLRSGTVCGSIVWETKRAENWSSKWVPKLKEDLQRVNGDIAVLVSTVFPADITDGIAQYEGIWLVRPDLVSGLAPALRTVLIEAQRQKVIGVGKGEQMEALFDYICSNQFAQRVRSVVESYGQMREDLEKEKAAMQRLWKKREGQIGRISDQIMSVCGELQGISSDSVPLLDSVAGLEFADDDADS